MKTTLEKLYYDSEGIVEKIKDSEGYIKVQNEFEKLFDKLLEEADGEQKNRLDDLFVLIGGLESETGLTYFKEGFKFCMRLIFEGLG